MKRGFEIGGKYSADPIGSDKARGKSRYQRKAARDGNTLTPTEQRQKNQLMKQFMKDPECGGLGRSQQFIENYDLIDWGKK